VRCLDDQFRGDGLSSAWCFPFFVGVCSLPGSFNALVKKEGRLSFVMVAGPEGIRFIFPNAC